MLHKRKEWFLCALGVRNAHIIGIDPVYNIL